MRRKVNHYTDEFKLRVVTEYLSTDITQRELKLKYGFKGGSALYKWISKFDMSIPDDSFFKKQEVMSKEVNKSKSEHDLEAKIKKLEAELEYEKLRTEALNTIINIAEERFNIPIRKKSGTKR